MFLTLLGDLCINLVCGVWTGQAMVLSALSEKNNGFPVQYSIIEIVGAERVQMI